MDIPSPEASADEQKIAVTTSASVEKPSLPKDAIKLPEPAPEQKPEEIPQTKSDLKDEAFAREEAERKKIAELIIEKKYFLPIKEKNATPMLTLSFLLKKNKTKRKKPASSKPFVAPIIGAVAPKAKKSPLKTVMSVVVLLLLLVGAFVAIDTGLIRPGFELPFHIFGKKKTAEAAVSLPAPTTASTVKSANPGGANPIISNPAGTLLLPQSGLKFTYDPKLFSATIEDGVNHDGTYGSLQFIDGRDAFIILSEYKHPKGDVEKVCIATKTCTDGIVDFTATKITGVKKRDLYYTTEIKKVTSTTATYYITKLHVSPYSKLEDMNDAAKSAFNVTSSDSTIYDVLIYGQLSKDDTKKISSFQFGTLEEAKTFLTSSYSLKLASLLQSVTD